MSPAVRRVFLEWLPKMMMMRRTEYLLPDYDDTAPCHGYTNEIDVRDSISEFPHEYKMDGHDSNFENMNHNHNMPHSSGKFDSHKCTYFAHSQRY